MRSCRFLSLALAVLSASFIQIASAGGVYRWVDKNGVVHYDDTNTVAERVTRDIFKQDIPDRPDWDGVVPPELVEEVAQRCSHARERLANYSAAPVIYGRDPSGNVYQLSSTQARLMLAEISAEADEYCGPDAPRRIYMQRKAEAEAERERRAAVRR